MYNTMEIFDVNLAISQANDCLAFARTGIIYDQQGQICGIWSTQPMTHLDGAKNILMEIDSVIGHDNDSTALLWAEYNRLDRIYRIGAALLRELNL